jgi:magnesium transporter
MLTIFQWDSSKSNCVSYPVEQLPPSCRDLHPDDIWWIDLSNPTEEEEERILGQFLPVHTLTFEDITRPRREADHGSHLPKVEEFPDYLFVIVNPLPPKLIQLIQANDGNPRPLLFSQRSVQQKHRPQLSSVLNHQVLITHHYEPLTCVSAARQFLERHAQSARRGPDYLFHQILDAMVDEYAPVVDRIATQLDKLEIRLFTELTPQLLARLLRMKRFVTELRKTIILEREVLARLIRGEFELVDDREVVYYRNVYDHLVRYTQWVESAREMVSDLMETHLSAMSNRLNEVMKVLAKISTTVLPMTLVAGIYGMNFQYMPELDWSFGYPMALAMMVILALGSLLFFRWKRWL